ncbi:MAG: hypothetical protein V4617_15245 [Gemmatimonadota bacterium]
MANAPVFQHASATPLDRVETEMRNARELAVHTGDENEESLLTRARRAADASRVIVEHSRQVSKRFRAAIDLQRAISPRERKVLEAAEVYRTVLLTQSSSEIVYAQRALLMAAVEP